MKSSSAGTKRQVAKWQGSFKLKCTYLGVKLVGCTGQRTLESKLNEPTNYQKFRYVLFTTHDIMLFLIPRTSPSVMLGPVSLGKGSRQAPEQRWPRRGNAPPWPAAPSVAALSDWMGLGYDGLRPATARQAGSADPGQVAGGTTRIRLQLAQRRESRRGGGCS